MKKPLSWALATSFTTALSVFILSYVLRVAQVNVKSMSICDYPIISSLPFCAAPATTPTSILPVHADFPSLMEIQHHALDQLTARAEIGADLALNIKHAELAVRDLIIMVQSSNLPIKDILAATLSDFIAEARQTARGLQVLSSKVQGTMDSISAFNVHAFRAINSAKESAVTSSSPSSVEDTVLRTFQTSLAWFTSSISAIIVDASTAAASLDRLDERLAAAHTLCLTEEFDNVLALDDVLWELWTRLGGNRNKVRDLKHRASVLRNVQKYRNVAVAYVAGTMQMLSAVDTELLELRDRLSMSSFESFRIPIEVQLESIESSVRRLRVAGSISGGSGSLGIDSGR
ncbi:hypothetical protein C8Q80DRAFT_1096010 [Daedaleopsis nitida]|nr:hypothetical protein C8Q80DRAFT_1096010 [Daedaleopsis nitida]